MERRRPKQTIWLLRHGESTWNASGLVQGQAASPELTTSGREQVATVAEALSGLPIRTIISSDLVRAQQTTSIVADKLGMPWSEDTTARERDFGCAEGRPLSALGPEWSGIRDGRVVDPTARPPGGESLRDFSQRVGSFFERLAQRGTKGDVLVVTHGGVIRVAMAKCDRVPVVGMAWGPVPNAGLWSVGMHEVCLPTLLSRT